MPAQSPFDILAEEIGAVAGQIERESKLRIDAALADLKRADAERELRFATVERDLRERLGSLRDGVDGRDGIDGKDGSPGRDGVDGRDGRDGIDGAAGKDGRDGIDGRDGKDGKDVSDIEVVQDGRNLEFAFSVGDVRSIFEIELPEGPAGRDGDKGDKGEPGQDGRLPEVREWLPGVHYAGEVKAYGGSTWQALRDTAAEPPHEDWVCIAAKGGDGRDGQSLNPRRLWSADEEYKRLDVVALNGGSFVALKDDPGGCPGDGWMLLTSQGKRGEKGEKGERGIRGPAGPSVQALTVDDEGMLTLTSADGSIVRCDLYPLLSRITKN